MRLRNILLLLPLFAVLALGSAGGCDGQNILAEEEPEEPGPAPGPDTSSTLVTGTVTAPDPQQCNGVDGFATGATVEIEMSPSGGTSEQATVMINGGTDGTFNCETGNNGQIDTAPITFIACTVTSASGIAGIAVNDLIEIGITFNFSPLTKEAGVIVNESACVTFDIVTLVAES
jgi:hypothetical protein